MYVYYALGAERPFAIHRKTASTETVDEHAGAHCMNGGALSNAHPARPA